MKLNDAVAKVYAFLNKIALNIPIVSKLFKNRASETSAAETATSETAASETNPADQNSSEQTSASAQKSQQKTNQKSKLRRIVEPIAFVLAGILCFSYPVVSTLWNNRVSKEISNAYDKYNHD